MLLRPRRFAPSQTAPEWINYPLLWGTGGLRKFVMYSDSRKAQRNSFAHYRAELLFSTEQTFAGTAPDGSAPTPTDSTPARSEARRQRVRAGLLGFVPISAVPAC